MTAPPITAVAQSELGRDRPTTTQSNKFEGFDYLRAIFSLVVVVLHANLLVVLTGKLHMGSLADVLKANVGYLAVPVFLQISLFLFFLKREKTGSEYFAKKRFPKLLSLYLFWSISKWIFDFVLTGESAKTEYAFSSIGGFIGFLIGGGYSPFYFFFSLLFLTALAEMLAPFLNRMSAPSTRRTSYYLLLACCILVASFPIIDPLISTREVFTEIEDPLAFLPYVFTAAIAVHEFKAGQIDPGSKSLKFKLYALLAAFLAFSILEWCWFARFPHYSRLSLVFGSWLLLYLSLLSTRKAPPTITFLSGCSLGIYGLHSFFTDHTLFLESLSQFVPGSGPLARFLIALVGSIALTLIFRRIKGLKEFV